MSVHRDRREYMRAYYEAHREEIAEKQRAYYEAHPGLNAEACRRRRERKKQWPTGGCARCSITGPTHAATRMCRDCEEVEAS